MDHPTVSLRKIMRRDPSAKLRMYREMEGATKGIYAPWQGETGEIQLSEAQYVLFFDAPEVMKDQIQIIDLSLVPEGIEVAV